MTQATENRPLDNDTSNKIGRLSDSLRSASPPQFDRQPLTNFVPRAGPRTPPIERTIKQLNEQTWGEGSTLHLQKHQSRLEREQAAALAGSANSQHEVVHLLVTNAIRAVTGGDSSTQREQQPGNAGSITSQQPLAYLPRHGPTTPPIVRTIRQQQQHDWHGDAMQYERHMSKLEREKLDAPAKESAARAQAQRVSKLVVDAFAAACAAQGEVYLPAGMHKQTDTLETTLNLLHRSRLEIEKARVLIKQGADTAAPSGVDARASARIAAHPPPSPRRAAYVHRMVDGMFKRAIQTHENPLALTKHASRLQREQAAAKAAHSRAESCAPSTSKAAAAAKHAALWDSLPSFGQARKPMSRLEREQAAWKAAADASGAS